MSTQLAALVLAGGVGRRMGGVDKPLLELGGRPIIAHILATLGREIADIAISANGDPARYGAFARPVIDDGPFLGQGPLAGLLAGLDWAATRGAGTLLTVPGDTPFIPLGLAAALAPAPAIAASAAQASVPPAGATPAGAVRPHFLVGLWPVAARAALRAYLAEPGSHPVREFTRRLGARQVDFPSLPCDPFLNVNNTDDLALARAVWSRRNPECGV